jgi:hypothetical protein
MVRVPRKGGLNTVQRLRDAENLLVIDSPQISKLKGKPRTFKAIPYSKFLRILSLIKRTLIKSL